MICSHSPGAVTQPRSITGPQINPSAQRILDPSYCSAHLFHLSLPFPPLSSSRAQSGRERGTCHLPRSLSRAASASKSGASPQHPGASLKALSFRPYRGLPMMRRNREQVAQGTRAVMAAHLPPCRPHEAQVSLRDLSRKIGQRRLQGLDRRSRRGQAHRPGLGETSLRSQKQTPRPSRRLNLSTMVPHR